MPHTYVWHDSFTCAPYPVHKCYMSHSYVWHVSFTCVTWFIHMCDMTHLYLGNDHGTQHRSWHIHMCDMTHSNLLHTSFICGSWFTHMCDMTPWYLCNGHIPQDSLEEFSHVACCCHLYVVEFVTDSRVWQIVTHSYVSTQSRRI